MQPIKRDVGELLELARQLLAQSVFDVDVALELLSTMPTSSFDTQTVGAITHARLVLLNGYDTPVKIAMTRFALTRVVALLERHS